MPYPPQEVGDEVLYRDVVHKAWKKGVIIDKEGSKVYRIQGEHGQIRKGIDHVVKYHQGKTSDEKPVQSRELKTADKPLEIPVKVGDPKSGIVENAVNDQMSESIVESESAPPVTIEARSSTRVRNAPERLTYSKLGG